MSHDPSLGLDLISSDVLNKGTNPHLSDFSVPLAAVKPVPWDGLRAFTNSKGLFFLLHWEVRSWSHVCLERRPGPVSISDGRNLVFGMASSFLSCLHILGCLFV